MNRSCGWLLTALLLLAGCGGADDPAAGELESDEALGRKRGWFYNGLSEHPRQAFAYAQAVAWRLPGENGQPLLWVWLSSDKLSDSELGQIHPALPGQPLAPGQREPRELGHAGVLLRFDDQGRSDGQMSDFCPRRNEQVQCLSMSGVGSVVVTAISSKRAEGALYTYDADSKLAYVAQFSAPILTDEVLAPPPEGLKWLGVGGGAPGQAFLKRNQAALDGDIATLKSLSMPETAEFLDGPGNAALIAKMAPVDPQVLGGSLLGDSARLFVRGASNTVRRVDMRLLDGQWRVQTTRQ